MSAVKEINEDNFEEEVIKSNIPVLVDFSASWCAPCRMQTPILEKLAQELEGKLKIVKVDTDQNPNLAMKLNIMSIPNLLLFKDGKIQTQLVGYHSEKELRAKINL